MRYTGQIQQALEFMKLPADAVEWLIDVWDVCQLLDDACDGDEIGRSRAEAAAWAIFVRMPAGIRVLYTSPRGWEEIALPTQVILSVKLPNDSRLPAGAFAAGTLGYSSPWARGSSGTQPGPPSPTM